MSESGSEMSFLEMSRDMFMFSVPLRLRGSGPSPMRMTFGRIGLGRRKRRRFEDLKLMSAAASTG